MSNIYYGTIPLCSNEELRHFGILGMKWGIRRYQNEDGTLTEAGKARYGSGAEKASKRDLFKQISSYEKSHSADQSFGTKLLNMQKQYQDKINKSAEAKRFDKAMNNIQKKLDRGIYEFDDDEMDEVLEAQEAYENYSKEFMKSFDDEYATSILHDLGYKEASDRGKQYVREIMYTNIAERALQYVTSHT